MALDSTVDILVGRMGPDHFTEQLIVREPVPCPDGRRGTGLARPCHSGRLSAAELHLFSDDLIAEVNALVADEDPGPATSLTTSNWLLVQNEQQDASWVAVCGIRRLLAVTVSQANPDITSGYA